MAKQPQQDRRGKQRRSVYLAFEYHKDRHRQKMFLNQAKEHCEFEIVDNSLPAAEHSNIWRKKAGKRIRSSGVVIVLLGPDTQNAKGVLEEMGLAGQWERPIIQLMPQKRNYGLAGESQVVCKSKWKRINEMLRDPKEYVNNPDNKGKGQRPA